MTEVSNEVPGADEPIPDGARVVLPTGSARPDAGAGAPTRAAGTATGKPDPAPSQSAEPPSFPYPTPT